MAYTILYNTMSIKLKNNKFIPMILTGYSNEYFENTNERFRQWQSATNTTNGQIVYSSKEYFDYIEKVIETTDCLSDNRIYKVGEVTPNRLRNFAKKTLENAISFDMAKKLGVCVGYNVTQKFKPQTEEELMEFLNKEENKRKTIWIEFSLQRMASKWCDVITTINKTYKPKSHGEFITYGRLKSKSNNNADEFVFIAKDENNNPIFTKDINEAYRLKKIEPKSSQTIKNALFDYFDFINDEDNRLISCGVAHISAFKHLNNEQK